MIRARAMLATLAAATSLAGCTMLDGYGGMSVGYGGGYYDDGYYDDGYYGDPYSGYYGWYEDYYYPGLGAYVYDRGGGRHSWNDRHRRYWEARRAGVRDRRELRENWSAYRRDVRGGRRDDWRADNGGDRRDGRDGWRARRESGQTPGQATGQPTGQYGRGERRGGWQGRGADASPSAPAARQWRRDSGQAGGEYRRERRSDAPPPAARAMPRSGSDAARSPRVQMEARPMPQASRPEPRPERMQSPASGEDLAARQPE